MDTEQLHVALQHSFSPDASIRSPAEATIKNLKHVKGAVTMLLQVAAEKQVQYEVRQAAAIQLKNICRECWVERVSFTGLPAAAAAARSSGPILLDEDDKAGIRTNLVEALLSEPEKSVRDLMAETVHSIAIHDFPDKWPNLLPTLLHQIAQSPDPAQALRVHNALLALRKICKRYEYKAKEQRGPLNDIVVQSFPLLLPLAQRLSDPNVHSLEAAMMLKQILKIFWSSTQFYLPSAISGAVAGVGVGVGGDATVGGETTAEGGAGAGAVLALVPIRSQCHATLVRYPPVGPIQATAGGIDGTGTAGTAHVRRRAQRLAVVEGEEMVRPDHVANVLPVRHPGLRRG